MVLTEKRKSRIRHIAAAILIMLVVPLCERVKDMSGASTVNAFAGEELVCAIDLGNEMYSSHGLETGFNYELLGRFAKDNRCSLKIVAFNRHTDYIDSLKAGRVDLVITHDHDLQHVEGIGLTRRVDECSVWAVNAENGADIRQMNSWISYMISSPEFSKIQKKYKGKSDRESMMKMNAETTAVYEKYGTSPAGGCMPMLLQMIILLALYGVISAIPSHVDEVMDIYMKASNDVYESIDEYSELNTLNNIMVENKIEGFEERSTFDKILDVYYENGKETKKTDIYKLLSDSYARQNAKLDTSRDAWSEMGILKDGSLEIIESIKNVKDEDWQKIKEVCKEENLELVNKYAEISDENLGSMVNNIDSYYRDMEVQHNKISDIYKFAGIDLSRSPSQEKSEGIWWALLIPLFAALTQWYSTHIAQKSQPVMEDNPMASSFKMMNIMFPIMSAFFCYSLAAGLGLYWIIGAVFQIGQQFFINKYFEKVDVQDIIKANVEKKNKRLERAGVSGNSISQAANYTAKNTNNTNDTENNSNKNKKFKEGGIASKANLVKNYNEKNNK